MLRRFRVQERDGDVMNIIVEFSSLFGRITIKSERNYIMQRLRAPVYYRFWKFMHVDTRGEMDFYLKEDSEFGVQRLDNRLHY